MKYTEAWAKIAQKNVNLKVALCLVTVCMMMLCYSTFSLSLKKPLLIERGCHSKPIKTSDTEKSPDEVKVFIKLALEQRFNANTKAHKAFLAKKPRRLKKQEQAGFSKKNIRQSILVNDIKISKKGILVDADRIMSVGTIRSATPFPLIIKMESQSRTQDNPYGLILTKVTALKIKKKGAKKYGR